MKSLIVGAAAALVVAVSGVGVRAEMRQIKGTLVDVACSVHANDAKFMAGHDRNCLQMEMCVKSGYSVITADHKVLKFDAKGNSMVAGLLKSTNRDKDWNIVVSGDVTGDMIAVSSLKLQ